MSYSEQINALYDHLKTSLSNGTFAKLTLGKTIGKTELTNVYFRTIVDNDTLKFNITFRYLSEEIIEKGFLQLASNDVVIGPAEDGGYYLLGMKSVHPNVFKNKSWGTSSVRKDTIKNLEKVNVHLLPMLNDIDVIKNKNQQLKDNKVIDNSDKELQLMNQLLLLNKNIENKKKENFENDKYDSKFKISKELYQRTINKNPEYMKNNELLEIELVEAYRSLLSGIKELEHFRKSTIVEDINAYDSLKVNQKKLVKKDIELLSSQIERCSEILKKLTLNPVIEDDFIDGDLTISDYVDEIIKSFQQTSTKEFIINYDQNSNPINITKSIEIVYGLRNFIGNANKFSENKIFINIKSDSDFTEVMIEDDGEGYPKDVLSKIGEPYIKSFKSSIKSKSGLGLGIFIGKTLLEKNYANILCKNSETRGGAEVSIKWKNEDLLKL